MHGKITNIKREYYMDSDEVVLEVTFDVIEGDKTIETRKIALSENSSTEEIREEVKRHVECCKIDQEHAEKQKEEDERQEHMEKIQKELQNETIDID